MMYRVVIGIADIGSCKSNYHTNTTSCFYNGQVFRQVKSVKNLSVYFVFSCVLLCVFMFWVLCCDVHYDFRIKTMFGFFLPPVLFVGRLMFYLRYLCLLACSDVQHSVLCFLLVLCTLWCKFLWTVHFVLTSLCDKVC
jgi:hypothetical protein